MNDFTEHIQVVEETIEISGPMLDGVVDTILKCLSGGGKVLACGNGGSAAQSEHLVAELAGRFEIERPGYAAISLNSAVAVLTAVANDYGYTEVFERQVIALAKPGDVVIGFSTSGTSANVERALIQAKDLGCETIAVIGGTPAPIEVYADFVLRVPSKKTSRIQELHLLFIHIICRRVEAGMK